MTKEYPYIEPIDKNLTKVHLNCDVTIEIDPMNDESLTIVEHRLSNDDVQTDFKFVKDGEYWNSDCTETIFRRDDIGTVSVKENGATLLNFEVLYQVYFGIDERYVKLSKIVNGYSSFKKFKKKMKVFNKCRIFE